MRAPRVLLWAALASAPACASSRPPAGPLPASSGPVGGVAASSSCPPADSVAASAPGAAISIRATIRADELRADSPVESSVRTGGTAVRSAVSCDERVNLDRPVRPGQTYRDVEIRYRLDVQIDSSIARALARDSVRRP